MPFGAYGPFPFRFGGGTPPLKHRVDGILAQLGTAYTKDTTGLVWLRAMAFARVFWDVWETNQRLANQWDPWRMTDFLGRWEKILAIPVSPSDSPSTRRARVAAAKMRSGYATSSIIYQTCQAYLGPLFIGIVTTPSTVAQTWTPNGWPTGNHPTFPTDPTWGSSTAHLVILTQQPAWMDDGTYYATRGSLMPALDAIMPAWMTFDVVRDGPGGAIFRLDDPHNLDNERFS